MSIDEISSIFWLVVAAGWMFFAYKERNDIPEYRFCAMMSYISLAISAIYGQ